MNYELEGHLIDIIERFQSSLQADVTVVRNEIKILDSKFRDFEHEIYRLRDEAIDRKRERDAKDKFRNKLILLLVPALTTIVTALISYFTEK